MAKLYQSYKDVPKDAWRWPNFSPREIACKGTGRVLVDEVALDKLQELRTALGIPLLITSAYRSPEHNKAVGGAQNSYHMKGVAFDIRMDNQDPDVFEIAAREIGFRGFGYYPKQGFMHIDLGPERTWGDRFPRSSTRLPAEQPQKTSKAQSTTLQATAVSATAVAAQTATFVQSTSGVNQTIVIVLAGIAVLGLLWIARERIKKWADGFK